MFSAVSNASRSSSSHAFGGLDLLASVVLTEHQIAHPSSNAVVDCNFSTAEDTAISDFAVRLAEVPKAVLASVKDKAGETSSTVDVNGSEKHESTTAGVSGIRNNKDKGNICTETFEEKLSLVHIRRRDERNRIYPCNKCEKTFAFLGRLKNHMLCHSDEKKFSCPKCHMKFKRKSSLKEHDMAIHGKDYVYQCGKCKQKFYTSSAFIHHKKDVHKEKMKCPNCSKCFIGISFLKNHLLVNHGVIKSVMRYTESGRLTKKQTADEGSVAGQPSTSGVQGKKSRVRQNHRKTKPGNAMSPITRSNPDYCSACNKAFRRKIEFSQHNIDKHGMQARYTCEYCSSGFFVPSYMRKHQVLMHPDKVEGRHNCDQCGKKFWNRSEHDRHIVRQHSLRIDTDQLECHYCHEKHPSVRSLKRHMLYRHPDQNISDNVCVYCKKQFAYSSLVQKHVREKHPDKQTMTETVNSTV